jgi:hypothetical protein
MKPIRIKMSLAVLCMGVIVLGMVASASALPINLDTAPVKFGEDTSQAEINSIISSLLTGDPDAWVYKSTPSSDDEGALASSYETDYSRDTENAKISYVGGPYVDPTLSPVYLLAKDGAAKDNNNKTHAWYLFDLSALGWNGTDTITITGLWPDQGNFSHITIYGTPAPVPEPSTMLLLGSGMSVLALIRARRKAKKG